jgi:citrate synthase
MTDKTEKNKIIFIPALDGVAPVKSSISLPDTDKGMLFLRGYPIDVLAEKASFEEVIYLLLFKEFPSQRALENFKELIKLKQNLPDKIISTLESLRTKMPLFNIMATAILSLAEFDSNIEDESLKANYDRALTLIAKTPIIIANAIKLIKTFEIKYPRQEFSPLVNFLHILGVPINEEMKRAFEVGQILCCEHEMNASTLAVRTAASTGSDIYLAISAGLSAFAGIYHGGASRFIIEMLRQIGDPVNVQKWADKKFASPNKKNRIIMGFGHRVYKGQNSDPRTAIFKKWSLRLAKNRQEKILLSTAETLEKYIGEKKNLCANVDFYFALVNHFIGFSPELSPLIYAMARVTGWAAHYIEQFYDPESRILRPRAIYTGPENQKWVDLKNR